MQLPAAYQLTAYGPRCFTTNPAGAQPQHRTPPPSSHQEGKIFQWSIGRKNTLCFQGGAEGAVFEPRRKRQKIGEPAGAVVSGQVKLVLPGGDGPTTTPDDIGGSAGAVVNGQVKLVLPGGNGPTTKPSDRDVGATGLRTLLSI
ncbi:hypothetical protein HG530_007610 [Fusarium avenaceum]|nr:hypothetical protein HG530_007610 [Fusarium avenaceum]